MISTIVWHVINYPYVVYGLIRDKLSNINNIFTLFLVMLFVFACLNAYMAGEY